MFFLMRNNEFVPPASPEEPVYHSHFFVGMFNSAPDACWKRMGHSSNLYPLTPEAHPARLDARRQDVLRVAVYRVDDLLDGHRFGCPLDNPCSLVRCFR